MSSFFDFFNEGINKDADTTGVKANLSSGKQRSYFLEPDVKASSLSRTLSGNEKLKGRSKSKDENGKLYPWGFTPEVDFYQDPKSVLESTGSPVERGNILLAGISDSNGNGRFGVRRDTNDILDQDVPNAFRAFKDMSNYEYLHRLDRGEIPIGIELTRDTDIYLSSYVETDADNEDPVSFGYDLIIDVDNSPLFNGAVEDFINEFGNYSEISSRATILYQFKQQFFKFFNVDTPKTLNIDSQPRTYYLQKIGGLNDLSESITSDKQKQFVDYGRDYITLTLREDVSVNTGFLAVLYKMLSWSRINGKKIIPDNLLRFDIEIVVTEARKFNRVIKNDDSTMDQYADLLSRYRYKLYECQFFFENYSHGDGIDMTNLGYNDNFDIKFNYKFTTMKFEKFTDENTVIGSDIVRKHIELDNSVMDISKIDPKTANRITIENNTIHLNPVDYVMNKYTPVGEDHTYKPILLPSNAVQNIDPFSSLSKSSPNKFQEKLNNMNVITNITTITDKTTLLQRTLENIETTFKSNLNRFIYDLKKDVLDFVPGNYLGGFTEDGYEYNIPAYYINKAFNTTNNTLRKSIGTLGRRIYEEKNVLVQGFLDNINQGIDAGENFLNNKILNPLTGYYNGGGVKPANIYDTKNPPLQFNNNPRHIYGDGVPTKIVYDGSSTNSDDAPDTPQHHSGTVFDIYAGPKGSDDNPDTPQHHSGTVFDIYAGPQGSDDNPDVPPHHTGSTFDIYAGPQGSDDNPDTPPRHTGSTFDIYAGPQGSDDNPDIPPHHTGSTFDIYAGPQGSDDNPDTPLHHVGTTFDIYAAPKGSDDNPDTPPRHTGSTFDIYAAPKGSDDNTDTPEHHRGLSRSIYDYQKEYEETPPHTTGDLLDIYKYEPNYEDTPAHHEGASLDIYETKLEGKPEGTTNRVSIYETKSDDIKPFTGKVNNIYDREVEHQDTPAHTENEKPLSIYTSINVEHDNVVPSLDIYSTNPKDNVEPVEKKNTLSIYDSTKETKDIKGGGNSLNIYGK